MPHRPALDAAELPGLLMSAALQLTAEQPVLPVALGVPVRDGRFGLGRLRPLVQSGDAPVAVAVGFDLACWLGADPAAAPALGRLWHRGTVAVDARGRIRLDRRVRAYLAVADPADFEVVPVPAQGGVLLVPVEGFERRWKAVAACGRS